MKLDRVFAALAIAVALGATACGSHAVTAQPAAPSTTAPNTPVSVSTTKLTAAELDEADDAPHVSKSQHSVVGDDSLKEEGVRKDDSRTTGRIDRKHGGGFSGYK